VIAEEKVKRPEPDASQLPGAVCELPGHDCGVAGAVGRNTGKDWRMPMVPAMVSGAQLEQEYSLEQCGTKRYNRKEEDQLGRGKRKNSLAAGGDVGGVNCKNIMYR
jgi:hypothetical protein